MEWKEVKPKQDNWQRQINITAYYGETVLGSIIYCDELEGWNSLVNDELEYLDAQTEEEAKQEMKDVLEMNFESERNYFEDLLSMLKELN